MEMLFNGRRDGRKWERAHRPQTLGIIQVVKNREPTNPSSTYFNCRIEFSLADLFPHFIFCFERKTFGIRIFHYSLSPNTVGHIRDRQSQYVVVCRRELSSSVECGVVWLAKILRNKEMVLQNDQLMGPWKSVLRHSSMSTSANQPRRYSDACDGPLSHVLVGLRNTYRKSIWK